MSSSRRMRAFIRWMKSNGVEYSDALSFDDDHLTRSISVYSLGDLHEGDLIATIPKSACLTIRTSGASEIIEQAGLAGSLGLAVAVMYERALGLASRWYDYFAVLPERESVPLVWSDDEVKKLLIGTELDKTVKEDKDFLREDWKESIEPLIGSGLFNLDPDWLGLEKFFSAKTLVSSRAFEIDDFHGYGMVPLADLFNHKTGAENIHFTSTSNSNSDSEDNDDNNNTNNNESSGDDTSVVDQSTSSSALGDDQSALEIIIVKDVKASNEVFNTYGYIGNAALLHRYGFTEPDNQFDLVNIELPLIMKLCSSKFTNRYARSRLSIFKKLNFDACTSQDSEYFEISFNGEPQFELLIFLYVIFLNEKSFEEITREIESLENEEEIARVIKIIEIGGGNCDLVKSRVENVYDLKDFLLVESVCEGLGSLADLREGLYGSGLLSDDETMLGECDYLKERKLYDSLVLRISERKILGRLRDFSSNYRSKSKKKRKFS